MEKIIGKVSEVKTSKTKTEPSQDIYSLKIRDKFYSGWGFPKYSTTEEGFEGEAIIEGDNVEIEYEVKGRYNNIKKITKTTITQTTQINTQVENPIPVPRVPSVPYNLGAKIGQAMNQALDCILTKNPTGLFEYATYKDLVKKFFEVNEEIEKEIVAKKL